MVSQRSPLVRPSQEGSHWPSNAFILKAAKAPTYSLPSTHYYQVFKILEKLIQCGNSSMFMLIATLRSGPSTYWKASSHVQRERQRVERAPSCWRSALGEGEFSARVVRRGSAVRVGVVEANSQTECLPAATENMSSRFHEPQQKETWATCLSTVFQLLLQSAS